MTHHLAAVQSCLKCLSCTGLTHMPCMATLDARSIKNSLRITMDERNQRRNNPCQEPR